MAMRLSVDCITNGESPSAIHGNTIFASTCRFSRFKYQRVFFPVRNVITHTADTACEITVASAAPRTPRPSTKMNSGSRAVFKSAPMSTVFMLTVAKPCAVM